MRLALAALALALAACARSPDLPPDLPPGGGWRRNFVELDNALGAAFAKCGLNELRHMNLGEEPNDGRGDSVQLALSTAAVNLNYLTNSGCLADHDVHTVTGGSNISDDCGSLPCLGVKAPAKILPWPCYLRGPHQC